MADRIRMPFGIVGRTGPGMRQVVGFGDRFTERGTFRGEFAARHCNQCGLCGVCLRQYVPQLSELRFGVVRAVVRGIAVLDGGPRRAREGKVWGICSQFLPCEMALRRRR